MAEIRLPELTLPLELIHSRNLNELWGSDRRISLNRETRTRIMSLTVKEYRQT